MKKLKLAGYFMLLLLIITACDLTGKSDSFVQADELDRKILELASQSKKMLVNKGGEIWSNSYKLDEGPIILVRRNASGKSQHAYLIGFDKMPEGAIKTDAPVNLGTVYSINNINRLKGEEKIPYYDFFFPFAGKKCYLMKYSETGFNEFGAEEWMKYYLHEGFHRYQFVQWKQSVIEESQDFNGYPYVAENLAAVLLEHHLLSSAVETADDAKCRSLLKTFAGVRKLRTARWPGIEKLEENQERFEGTARYLEHRIGAAAAWKSPVSVVEYLKLNSADGKSKVKDEIGFGRYYETGAAIGLLMDRLKIDWCDDVENGYSPAAVLGRKLGSADILWNDIEKMDKWAGLMKTGREMAARAAKEPAFKL